jgi:nucleoside 2-deoxyribosyltransferase
MAERHLRCFVAMAVGHTDTNRVYDKYIAPTLRAAGIRTVFMGRLEHNDDIDKRIMREIHQCDFAIADLTYARPSVYFEAGYAERNVPVIYTARKDHFNALPNDEFGNFRVHFDLLMRNIIPWSSATDSTFPRRLARRISKVIAPMLRQQETKERIRAGEIQFHGLSLFSRLEIVAGIFTKALKRTGYRPLVKNDESNPWIGRIPGRYTMNVCVASAQASFTQTEIQRYVRNMREMLGSRFESFDNDKEGYKRQRWQYSWPGYKLPSRAETRYVRKIVAWLVLCSLEKIPRGRLAMALPYYSADGSGQVLRSSVPVRANNKRLLPALLNVCVIDGIKSGDDAITKGREVSRAFRRSRSPKPLEQI